MFSAYGINQPRSKNGATKTNTGTDDWLVFESSEPFSIIAEKRWDGIIEYSLDGLKWQEWDGKQITSKNNLIYVRGYGNTVITGSPEKKSWCFDTTAELMCKGNIEVLLDYRLARMGKHPKMKADCYACMFLECKSLKEAPALPATKLAYRCYASMFKGCTSLEKVPALPATELAYRCYASMFKGCTSLEKVPALPATELAYRCYDFMFYQCTSLKEVPPMLK